MPTFIRAFGLTPCAVVTVSSDRAASFGDALVSLPPLQQNVYGSSTVVLSGGGKLARWFQSNGERWADHAALMGGRKAAGATAWAHRRAYTSASREGWVKDR